MKLLEKIDTLSEYISLIGDISVAFSGGTDSAFLLSAASRFASGRVLAVTVKTPYIPERIISECREFCKDIGINHEIIKIPAPEEIFFNPFDRCYICKKEMIGSILKYSESRGIKNVVEGSNLDDLSEYRPGFKAVKEKGVLSPLADLFFSKNEIKDASKIWELSTWNKPSYTCSLTRFPYGEEINDEKLSMVEEAENYLYESGIKGVRVRTHGEIAIIEVPLSQHEMIIKENLASSISSRIKEAGFQYVTLDLEGYKSGKMDIDIKNKGINRND
jgi:uncharacterized protein